MSSSKTLALSLTLLSLLQGACGYTLKGAQDNHLKNLGVETLYIEPFNNRTYKPGTENLVYNAIVKTIAANRKIRITYNKEEADAILTGAVDEAAFTSFKKTNVTQTNVTGSQERIPDGHPDVSSVYSATLTCSFQLRSNKRTDTLSQGQTLWSSGVTRKKRFNASNQFSVLGTTSSIINDSEFERALSDLATSMMGDVHEFMLAMF